MHTSEKFFHLYVRPLFMSLVGVSSVSSSACALLRLFFISPVSQDANLQTQQQHPLDSYLKHRLKRNL